MEGFREIRTSVGVRRVVNEQAERVAERANAAAKRGKYRWSGRERKTRYGAIVFTDDYQARIDNGKRNTLLKALG